MKLSIGSFLSPSKRSPKKKNRTISLSAAPSFGSNRTTASDDDSTSFQNQSTPRSVIPQPARRAISDKASSSGSDESWPSLTPLSLSELFTAFRRDRNGRITLSELEAVLRRVGPDPPSDEEVASMVAEVGCDGDGCVSLERLGALGSTDPVGAELRDAFSVFDTDGDGKISAEELLEVFLSLGDDGCTLDHCRRMIDGVDTDGDGFVCFDDFVRLMGVHNHK